MSDTISLLQSLYDRVHALKAKEPDYLPFELHTKISGSEERFFKRMCEQSTISLIIGKRGCGKTALGMKLLEGFNKRTHRLCYAIGFRSVTGLPLWIHHIDEVEGAPVGAVVLVDEGAVLFNSRDSGSQDNKGISKLMAVARHKDLSLILITQNSAMIDVNVLRLADHLIIKQPSRIQSQFERKPLKDTFNKVKPFFEKFQGLDSKQCFYVDLDDDFEGVLRAGLPEFWTDSVSKSFASY